MDNLSKLFRNVEQWASDKGINKPENAPKQMMKVVEEIGETAAALAREDKEMLEDAIGDSIVTLIILAQQNAMMADTCLAKAYAVIANRKGETIGGVFVKQEDLNPTVSDDNCIACGSLLEQGPFESWFCPSDKCSNVQTRIK